MILDLPHTPAAKAGPRRIVLFKQSIEFTGMRLIEHRRQRMQPVQLPAFDDDGLFQFNIFRTNPMLQMVCIRCRVRTPVDPFEYLCQNILGKRRCLLLQEFRELGIL